MSSYALMVKKLVMQNYFLCHPDSRGITVVKDSRALQAFFDNGNFTNNKDAGNMMQSKNVPHFTLFSSDVGNIAKDDILTDNATGKQYKVTDIQRDKTEETFQAQLFCVEVKA